MGEAVSHVEILAAVRGLDAKIDSFDARFGREELDPGTGSVVATGVFARLRAIESREQSRDQQDELNRLRWTNRIMGVTFMAGACVAIIMWFAGDRIEATREIVRKSPEIQAQAKTIPTKK